MENSRITDKQGLLHQALNAQQRIGQQLKKLKEENQQISDLYEEAVTRSNALTLEVEIARLEFEQVFNAVADPTWVLNLDYTILRINKAFLTLLGLEDKASALSQKCYELFPTTLCQSASCPLKQIQKGKKQIELDEERNAGKDRKIPFLSTAMPLRGLSGEIIGLVQLFKDITERKHYEEVLERTNKELEQLAAIDGLTQVANRRIFDERLKNEWLRTLREKQTLALLLCDIDFFKLYNDNYGHQMGDECLQAVAATIKKCLNRPADLVARYGGEEFGVLHPNTHSEGALHVAESIRQTVYKMKRAHKGSNVSDSVTLSIGVAVINPSLNSHNPEALLKAADLALYSSKKSGRNVVTLGHISEGKRSLIESGKIF